MEEIAPRVRDEVCASVEGKRKLKDMPPPDLIDALPSYSGHARMRILVPRKVSVRILAVFLSPPLAIAERVGHRHDGSGASVDEHAGPGVSSHVHLDEENCKLGDCRRTHALVTMQRPRDEHFRRVFRKLLLVRDPHNVVVTVPDLPADEAGTRCCKPKLTLGGVDFDEGGVVSLQFLDTCDHLIVQQVSIAPLRDGVGDEGDLIVVLRVRVLRARRRGVVHNRRRRRRRRRRRG
mmetsp:Transcript_62860/g.147948  ORF Transcript_62860/g.147948 Transcript_62860/m.147948 type:complete len:235 (-) Transcript_62860:187-891(-)